jgi:hypothetical protein
MVARSVPSLLPRAAIIACRHENAIPTQQTVDDSQTALEIAARSSYVPEMIITGVRFRAFRDARPNQCFFSSIWLARLECPHG